MKKFSLHIGLNNVNTSVYTGMYRSLKNAENDTLYYHSIAGKQMFETVMQLGSAGTSHNLLNELKSIAGKMQAGDLFFLSYSGHGTRVKDLNGDEDDGYDEALVLYDRILVDDELSNCWPMFPSQAAIFFINDSCYNGTVTRFFETKAPMFRNFLSDEGGKTYRGIDTEISDPDFEKNIDFYKTIHCANPDLRDICPVIHIAACKDNQLADDGTATTGNGLFTSKFKELYKDGFNGSYLEFYNRVLSVMPAYQTPYWDTDAGRKDEAFEKSQLLTIS